MENTFLSRKIDNLMDDIKEYIKTLEEDKEAALSEIIDLKDQVEDLKGQVHYLITNS